MCMYTSIFYIYIFIFIPFHYFIPYKIKNFRKLYVDNFYLPTLHLRYFYIPILWFTPLVSAYMAIMGMFGCRRPDTFYFAIIYLSLTTMGCHKGGWHHLNPPQAGEIFARLNDARVKKHTIAYWIALSKSRLLCCSVVILSLLCLYCCCLHFSQKEMEKYGAMTFTDTA